MKIVALWRVILVFFISNVCISNLAYANDKPKTLTLSDAILLALRYDPAIKTAEIQRVMDKFNLRLAHYNYEAQYALTGAAYTYTNTVSNNGPPTITAPLTVSPTVTLPNATRYGTQVKVTAANQLNYTYGSPHTYNPGVTVSVIQPLLQGSNPAVVLQPWYDALDTERMNKLALKNTVMDQITQIIGQYVATINAQNTITTNQQSLQTSQQTLTYNQAKAKAGQFARADLIQAQSDIANSQVNVQQSKISFLTDKYALLSLLGLDPNTAIVLPDHVDMGNEKIPTLQQAIAEALQNNIAYQNALITLRIDERAVTVAKDQQRWQLNLVASRAQGNGTGGAPNSGLTSMVNGSNVSTSVGLTLTVPINDVPLKGQLVAAKVALEQERINLEKVKRDTITSVTNNYNTLLIQQQQTQQAKQAVDLARQNLFIMQTKAKYGRASQLDLSTVQNNLTAAEISYLNTESSYLTNIADFEETIGTTLDHWGIKIRY
jgi:outer membrane protein TolC